MKVRTLDAIYEAVAAAADEYKIRKESAENGLKEIDARIAQEEAAQAYAAQTGNESAHKSATSTLAYLAARKAALEKQVIDKPFSAKEASALYVEIDRSVNATVAPHVKELYAMEEAYKKYVAAAEDASRAGNQICAIIYKNCPDRAAHHTCYAPLRSDHDTVCSALHTLKNGAAHIATVAANHPFE